MREKPEGRINDAGDARERKQSKEDSHVIKSQTSAKSKGSEGKNEREKR